MSRLPRRAITGAPKEWAPHFGCLLTFKHTLSAPEIAYANGENFPDYIPLRAVHYTPRRAVR